jgi:predicted PurR-regulated permease PerM
MVATLIGLYVCYLLVRPFLAALAWALTLAVLAAPLHRRLEQSVRRPNLAATISVVLIAFVVILPIALLGQQLLTEFTAGLTAIQEQLASGDLQRKLESHPLLAQVTSMIEGWLDVRAIFGNIGSWLTGAGGAFVRESLTHLITAVLTFYLLSRLTLH